MKVLKKKKKMIFKYGGYALNILYFGSRTFFFVFFFKTYLMDMA